MLDAKNAKDFAVGALVGAVTKDSDHLRGRISVYDADAIDQMEQGKTQISVGYTCDLIEKPGNHHKYGKYDAQQTNVVANHIAIVDKGRAGSAYARMDGLTVIFDSGEWLGPDPEILAADKNKLPCRLQESCQTLNMSQDVRTDEGGSPDPDDLASRNAAGETSAKPADKVEAPETVETTDGLKTGGGMDADSDSDPDDDGDDDSDPDDDGDEDEYADCMDADGDLTAEDRHKMAASSFAVPDREGLPIHDPEHTRAAMARFGQFKFKDPDEKHAGFNRILKKAKQFGVSSEGFQKAHASKLDRQDRRSTKYMNDLKKAQAELATQTKRADSATSDLATAQGKITSLQTDLDNLKKARTDAAEDVLKTIDSKVALVVEARSVGAAVDSKMSDKAIQIAVIKHVDKLDVADDKHPEYVKALYEGALTRAKKDAADTVAGANALGALRETAEVARVDAIETKTDENDEAAARARMSARTASAWAIAKQEKN